MLNTVAVIAAVYGVIAVVMFLAQRALLYHPDRSSPVLETSGVPDMTAVTTDTDDGLKLLSWYKPAKAGRSTIVFFQGNAGHIGHRDYKVRPYLDAGFGAMLAGYRGYGGNPGGPTEDGLYRDARAALSFLAGEGVSPGRMVLYGESLGSGIAVQAAAEMARSGTPAGALVLEAPFTSIGDVAQSHYPFLPAKWLVRDRFDSLSRIAGISTPLLIFHGTGDNVVPFRLGRRLFDAALEPKENRWIEGGRHSDLDDRGIAGMAMDFINLRLR